MYRIPSRTRWFSLVATAALACADADPPKTAASITESALLAHVEVLADDSMMGRGAGTPHELVAAEYVRATFESYGLEPGASEYLQTFAIDRGQSPDAGSSSQNVLATLPGRGALAGQWIVVGAHYDHLGWRRISDDSTIIFNGADDNASGTALVLELARYLEEYFTEGEGQASDRRSIMFHAYGAEEIGLVGSRHFCLHPTVSLDNVVAMVNFDMVGRLQQNGLTLIGSSSAAFWEGLIADANTDGLPYSFDDKYLSGSDQWCYYDAGLPVLFFFTNLHIEYHTPFDDVWLIDSGGMVDVAQLAARALLELAVQPTLQ